MSNRESDGADHTAHPLRPPSGECPVCGEIYNIRIRLSGSFTQPDEGKWCYDNGDFLVHQTLKWENNSRIVGPLGSDDNE